MQDRGSDARTTTITDSISLSGGDTAVVPVLPLATAAMAVAVVAAAVAAALCDDSHDPISAVAWLFCGV